VHQIFIQLQFDLSKYDVRTYIFVSRGLVLSGYVTE